MFTITIDIDENEIADRVKDIVSERIAQQLQHEIIDRGDHLSYRYHTYCEPITRQELGKVNGK